MKSMDLKSVKYDRNQEQKVKRNFFQKLKGAAGKVPFVKDALALYYCAVDPNTPLYVKGVAFAALAYFISPLDAIPDALAGLGFTDDAGVIVTALKVLGNQVTEEHKQQAKQFFEHKTD